MTAKDIFYVFEGSEFSDGFPGVAHHVVDDLWLDGFTLLAYLQLGLVLEDIHKRDGEPHRETRLKHFTVYIGRDHKN